MFSKTKRISAYLATQINICPAYANVHDSEIRGAGEILRDRKQF